MPYTGSPLTPDPNKKYSFSFHNDIKNEKNNVRKSANPQNLKDEIMNNKEIKDLLNKYEMKRKTINTSVKPKNTSNLLLEEKIKKEKKKENIKKEKEEKNKEKDNASTNSIFWKKETINKVWNTLREVKIRVQEKKEFDYNLIIEGIANGDLDEVYETLISEEFKKFYRNRDNLFPQDVFMDFLVENGYFDLLIKMLEDPVYVFDKDYIFKCIQHIIEPENKDQIMDKLMFDQNILLNSNNNNNMNNETSSRSRGSSYRTYSKRGSILSRKKTSLAGLSDAKIGEIMHNIITYKLYDQKNEDKLKIIAWAFAQYGFYEQFIDLITDNNSCFTDELNQFNNFNSNEDIANFAADKIQYQNTLEYCLRCGYEDLAIFISEVNTGVFKESVDLPLIAAETENMKFLKYLWEKDTRKKSSFFEKREISRHSRFLSIFDIRNVFHPNFSINSIIKILIENDNNLNHKNKSNININHILSWKDIEKDKSFLQTLFQYECYEQICILIGKWPPNLFSNVDFFKECILKKQKELILFYVTRNECRTILNDHTIQEFIVREYLSYGEYFFYGAEMISYIFRNNWDIELTKDLCKNITKVLKTKDILNCHSPILSCLLFIEFINEIKGISLSEVTKCEKVVDDLIEFCKNVQESNHNESYISFLMKQKDTKDRTAFQIISELELYTLLETPEIGTIVKKMWNGTLSTNSLFSASSIGRFLLESAQTISPFNSFDKIDSSKVYFFQLNAWLDSCSLRFHPNSLFSIFLVIDYNFFIFLMNDYGELLNNYDQLSSLPKLLLTVYLVMVHLLVYDVINQILFIIKTKRPFNLDIWAYLDIFLFIFAWLILLDTKKVTGEYKAIELSQVSKDLLWGIQLPFLKLLEDEDPTFSTHVSFWARVFILAINDILVWCRVAGILLTFKQMGPIIRMIFAMGKLLLKYIVLIVLFLACCAGLFTLLFNRHSSNFKDFSTSVVTLFGAFVNDFDWYNFDDKYFGFGSMLYLVYVCISAVLFINLLIAVLSNVFEELNKVVDASNRAVLIQFYKSYRWDPYYGYLIFLSPPFNFINIPIFIINCFYSGSQEKFNKYVTRVYYLIFYFPFIAFSFYIYSFFIIIFAYFKGYINVIKLHSITRVSIGVKIFDFFNWVFLGIFFLLYIHLRDFCNLFAYIFIESEEKGDQFERIRKNMTDQDIVIFLKFIHSPQALQYNEDVHSLFMAYLDFESNQKIEMNQELQDKKKYLNKISKSGGKNNDQTKIMMYNNLESNGENVSTIYTAYIRKNLMIIEILENFVLDGEELENSYVNVEKMRKLLPLTLNIKNHHLRRLIHSDVRSLITAMSKVNTTKLSFTQYQLINKVMAISRRLDKDIDLEILKCKRFIANSEKLKNNIRKSIFKDENEYPFINNTVKNEKFSEFERLKKYNEIINKILNDISLINQNMRMNNQSKIESPEEEISSDSSSSLSFTKSQLSSTIKSSNQQTSSKNSSNKKKPGYK